MCPGAVDTTSRLRSRPPREEMECPCQLAADGFWPLFARSRFPPRPCCRWQPMPRMARPQRSTRAQASFKPRTPVPTTQSPLPTRSARTTAFSRANTCRAGRRSGSHLPATRAARVNAVHHQRQHRTPIIDPSGFVFPFMAGADVGLIRYGQWADFDFRYFGVNQWNSQQGPINAPPGATLAGTGAGSPDPLTISASDIASLNSVETNLRRNVNQRLYFLAGLRYISFKDKLTATAIDVAAAQNQLDLARRNEQPVRPSNRRRRHPVGQWPSLSYRGGAEGRCLCQRRQHDNWPVPDRRPAVRVSIRA